MANKKTQQRISKVLQLFTLTNEDYIDMINVTADFAAENNGYTNDGGINEFAAVQCNNPVTANYGKWVCAVESLTMYPELFVGTDFPTIQVSQDDFIGHTPGH